MDKLNEIFDSIKERFTNPLIFSFVCSWFVSNWPITVALIWYDNVQIANEGYHSIYNFIDSKLNWCHSLIYPLCFALLYTLLSPIIRNAIKIFNTMVSKWGEDKSLEILSEGKISINKYISLRKEYQNRSSILEEVIKNESVNIKKYEETKTELFGLQNEHNEVIRQLNDANNSMRQLRDVSVLNGTWEVKYEFPDGRTGKETIYIFNNSYNIVTSFGQEHKFDIIDFYFDNRNENVFFIKSLNTSLRSAKNQSEFFNFNHLRFNGKNILLGTENSTTKIEYRRS